MFENQKKKIKYGNKRIFYIKFYLKDYLEIEFTALLR